MKNDFQNDVINVMISNVINIISTYCDYMYVYIHIYIITISTDSINNITYILIQTIEYLLFIYIQH